MTVKPFAPRHTTTDLGDALRIKLPSRKNWFVIVFLGVWLAVWLAAELAVLGFAATGVLSLLRSGAPAPALATIAFPGAFALVWLTLWTGGGAFAAYTWLWNVAGRELIEVTVGSVRLSRQVLGWGRARDYLAEHIQDLRVSPQTLPAWPSWHHSGSPFAPAGQLAFDYGARTIRFGDADEAEAKQMLAEIRQRFPQYRPRARRPDEI